MGRGGRHSGFYQEKMPSSLTVPLWALASLGTGQWPVSSAGMSLRDINLTGDGEFGGNSYQGIFRVWSREDTQKKTEAHCVVGSWTGGGRTPPPNNIQWQKKTSCPSEQHGIPELTCPPQEDSIDKALINSARDVSNLN